MKKFDLVSEVIAYVTKPDELNTDPRYLVSGSQNVLINDAEKVEIRGGYTLLGVANTSNKAIESSYDWENSTGGVLNLRGYDDELEVYLGTVDGVAVSAWTRVLASWTAVDFQFAKWWDTTEELDGLLIVNGSDKIWSWGGGVATVASVTSDSITKNGTTTWAQNRFLQGTGKLGITTKLMIGSIEYTYTGGETTTTLTGVTPDPTGTAVNSVAIQSITEHDNEPFDGAINDIISELDNQIYVGSNKTNEVYVSKNTDFTDFAFSTPRVPGEGTIFVLDNPAMAFARQEYAMFISAGRSDWYKTEFQQLDISGTLTETFKVKKLKTGVESGAISQDLCAEMGNYIVFMDYNNRLRLLGQIENIENPYLTILSDPIKPDFDAETFTGGHIKPFKNRIYIASPTNSKVYICETRQNNKTGEMETFWQPPQVLPVAKFATRSGYLYGHSNSTAETYKLFDGTDDNTKSFQAKAVFSYRNFGKRDALKVFDEFFVEGSISANTDITLKLRYDYDGFTQLVEKTIEGDDDDILFEPYDSGAMGDQPMGDAPMGDLLEVVSANPRFKVIFDLVPQDFFELQVEFQTDTQDAQWSILSNGCNIKLSPNQPTHIHK